MVKSMTRREFFYFTFRKESWEKTVEKIENLPELLGKGYEVLSLEGYKEPDIDYNVSVPEDSQLINDGEMIMYNGEDIAITDNRDFSEYSEEDEIDIYIREGVEDEILQALDQETKILAPSRDQKAIREVVV